VFETPAGTYRGLSVRAYDAVSRQWQSWWLDGRNPSRITPSVRGVFSEGIGTLTSAEELDGKRVVVRSSWSNTRSKSPHWEQAWSKDGGKTWETIWIADFTRVNA
jgi:hypothetical protein